MGGCLLLLRAVQDAEAEPIAVTGRLLGPSKNTGTKERELHPRYYGHSLHECFAIANAGAA
jgi:hypothetical protein